MKIDKDFHYSVMILLGAGLIFGFIFVKDDTAFLGIKIEFINFVVYTIALILLSASARHFRKRNVKKAIEETKEKWQGKSLPEIPDKEPFQVIMQTRNPHHSDLKHLLLAFKGQPEYLSFATWLKFVKEDENDGSKEILKELPEGKPIYVKKRERFTIERKKDHYQEAVPEEVYLVFEKGSEKDQPQS